MKNTITTRTETQFVYFLNRDITIEGCKFAKGERLINGNQHKAKPEQCFVHCGQFIGTILVPADAVDVYERTVTFVEETQFKLIK
jgi:hypothetical protein